MQVVVYDLDGASVFSSMGAASEKIKEVYGNKLGAEACTKLSDGRPGMVYRKNGGPRIELVTEDEAERIRAKERELANSL